MLIVAWLYFQVRSLQSTVGCMGALSANPKELRCNAILIVEDEPTIRENLQMLLELEGFPVYTASNGEEGLRILRELPKPCLIFLDLLMPVMNGMEFLEAKSHEDAIAAIPVCIVSGCAEKPDTSKTCGYVKKPINLDVLMSFVKKYCGTPYSESRGR